MLRSWSSIIVITLGTVASVLTLPQSVYADTCVGLTQTACSSSSTCLWDFTLSTCNDPSASLCPSHLDVTACRAGGCFWDLWVTQCFESVSVASSQFACPAWTDAANGYPSPQSACTEHGCELLGSACVTPEGGNVAYVQIAHDASATWERPFFQSEVNSFGFHVTMPFHNAYRAENEWTIMQVGNLDVSIDVNEIPDACTTLSTKNTLPINYELEGIPHYSARLDYHAASWIDTYGNLDFDDPVYPGELGGNSDSRMINSVPVSYEFDPSPLLYKRDLKRAYGPFKVGGGRPVYQVARSTNGEKLDFEWRLDIQSIKSCPGVSEQQFPEYSVLQIPTVIIQETVEGGLISVSNTFRLTQAQSGGITVSPNSRYTSHVWVDKAIVLPGGGCPVGSSRLYITYKGTFSGVESGIWVGPVDIASDTVPFVDNQYGDAFTYITRLPCIAGVCSFQTQSQSDCQVLTPDGRAFKVRGTIHSWQMNVRSCSSETDTICAGGVINLAADGSPDPVTVDLPIDATPGTDIRTRVEVALGMFDSATTMQLADLNIYEVSPAQGPNAITGLTEDLPITFAKLPLDDQRRNRQISWKQPIVVAMRLVESLMSMDLRIGIGAGQMLFTALNADGSVKLNGNGDAYTLNYAQLKPYMDYVPKNTKASCPGCKLMPLAVERRGMDGFSIPMTSLLNQFGVAFQGLRIQVTFFVGNTDGSNAGGAFRRLLSTLPTQTIIQYNPDGSVSGSWNIFVDTTGLPSFNPTLTYWNETSNATVSVGLNPVTIFTPPTAPDMLPADSEVSLVISVITVFIVDLVLTMFSFLGAK